MSDGQASACEWCGVAIRQDPDGSWLAVKSGADYASECHDSEDALHSPGCAASGREGGGVTHEPKPCARCGGPRPKGRTRYCGDDCWKLSLAERTRLKDDKRVRACHRCGGPKSKGVQGGRFCDECRRVVADASSAAEIERARRRNMSKLDAKLDSGKRIHRRDLDTPEGLKWCARCQEFRPLTSFAKRKDINKQVSYCIPCQKAYNRERRVWLHYGITYDEYELLLACQDFRCAICLGRPRKNALSVDHDHKTGEIRGLLCSRCNHRLLGSANDDPARLRKAADYLEAYAPRDVFGEAKHVPGSQPATSLRPDKDAA